MAAMDTQLLHQLEDRIALLEAQEAALERRQLQEPGVNGGYMLLSGFLVFFMQAGFAMLCAGSVRSKNTMNILLKNVLDACAGAIAWWAVGFAFAYGSCKENNKFIGCANFFHDRVGDSPDYQTWFFQWAFSAAAATIVSGSVAERTTLIAYFLYSVFLTGFVYPVVVHWVWDANGFLSAFHAKPLAKIGMIDFAGSGVVHMVGGVAGLVGAIAVGPRIGRFDAEGKPVTLPGHSATLVVLGTFILWFGWYGFNPGSTLAIADEASLKITAHTAVTTTLAAAAGGVTSLFLVYFLTGVWDLLAVCNGLLAGLVSITAGCSVVQAWAAVLIGFIGAFVFYYSCKLLEKLKIDDPLLASPMHGFCGMWGVFVVGLLAEESKLRMAYSSNYAVVNVAAVPRTSKGAFYKGDGRLLGCQICGIVCITAWTAGMMTLLFFPLKFLGLLRVPQDFEMAGLDASKHGGSAYNMESDQMKKSPAGF